MVSLSEGIRNKWNMFQLFEPEEEPFGKAMFPLDTLRVDRTMQLDHLLFEICLRLEMTDVDIVADACRSIEYLLRSGSLSPMVFLQEPIMLEVRVTHSYYHNNVYLRHGICLTLFWPVCIVRKCWM